MEGVTMEKVFAEQFEALLEKYSELLVGESNAETKEKVKAWALYSHIAKVDAGINQPLECTIP